MAFLALVFLAALGVDSSKQNLPDASSATGETPTKNPERFSPIYFDTRSDFEDPSFKSKLSIDVELTEALFSPEVCENIRRVFDGPAAPWGWRVGRILSCGPESSKVYPTSVLHWKLRAQTVLGRVFISLCEKTESGGEQSENCYGALTFIQNQFAKRFLADEKFVAIAAASIAEQVPLFGDGYVALQVKNPEPRFPSHINRTLWPQLVGVVVSPDQSSYKIVSGATPHPDYYFWRIPSQPVERRRNFQRYMTKYFKEKMEQYGKEVPPIEIDLSKMNLDSKPVVAVPSVEASASGTPVVATPPTVTPTPDSVEAVSTATPMSDSSPTPTASATPTEVFGPPWPPPTPIIVPVQTEFVGPPKPSPTPAGVPAQTEFVGPPWPAPTPSPSPTPVEIVGPPKPTPTPLPKPVATVAPQPTPVPTPPEIAGPPKPPAAQLLHTPDVPKKGPEVVISAGPKFSVFMDDELVNTQTCRLMRMLVEREQSPWRTNVGEIEFCGSSLRRGHSAKSLDQWRINFSKSSGQLKVNMCRPTDLTDPYSENCYGDFTFATRVDSIQVIQNQEFLRLLFAALLDAAPASGIVTAVQDLPSKDERLPEPLALPPDRKPVQLIYMSFGKMYNFAPVLVDEKWNKTAVLIRMSAAQNRTELFQRYLLEKLERVEQDIVNSSIAKPAAQPMVRARNMTPDSIEFEVDEFEVRRIVPPDLSEGVSLRVELLWPLYSQEACRAFGSVLTPEKSPWNLFLGRMNSCTSVNEFNSPAQNLLDWTIRLSVAGESTVASLCLPKSMSRPELYACYGNLNLPSSLKSSEALKDEQFVRILMAGLLEGAPAVAVSAPGLGAGQMDSRIPGLLENPPELAAVDMLCLNSEKTCDFSANKSTIENERYFLSRSPAHMYRQELFELALANDAERIPAVDPQQRAATMVSSLDPSGLRIEGSRRGGGRDGDAAAMASGLSLYAAYLPVPEEYQTRLPLLLDLGFEAQVYKKNLFDAGVWAGFTRLNSTSTYTPNIVDEIDEVTDVNLVARGVRTESRLGLHLGVSWPLADKELRLQTRLGGASHTTNWEFDRTVTLQTFPQVDGGSFVSGVLFGLAPAASGSGPVYGLLSEWYRGSRLTGQMFTLDAAWRFSRQSGSLGFSGILSKLDVLATLQFGKYRGRNTFDEEFENSASQRFGLGFRLGIGAF